MISPSYQPLGSIRLAMACCSDASFDVQSWPLRVNSVTSLATAPLVSSTRVVTRVNSRYPSNLTSNIQAIGFVGTPCANVASCGASLAGSADFIAPANVRAPALALAALNDTSTIFVRLWGDSVITLSGRASTTLNALEGCAKASFSLMSNQGGCFSFLPLPLMRTSAHLPCSLCPRSSNLRLPA